MPEAILRLPTKSEFAALCKRVTEAKDEAALRAALHEINAALAARHQMLDRGGD